MPTIESSYSYHATKTISDFEDPDVPALAVAIEVMNATESFLWVRPSIARCLAHRNSEIFVALGLHTAPTSPSTLSQGCYGSWCPGCALQILVLPSFESNHAVHQLLPCLPKGLGSGTTTGGWICTFILLP